MSADTKTGNFLNAIQKYADEQKHTIRSEVEKFKAEELKKAEDEGIKDAHALIQKEMASMRTGIAGELARKEDEGKQQLYRRRSEMVDEVFDKAQQKLKNYTQTEQYKTSLLKNAAEAARYFAGEQVVVCIKQEDMPLKDEIEKCFNNNCSVEAVSSIYIGGLKAQCERIGIVVDFTLDTKLENQREWFCKTPSLRFS